MALGDASGLLSPGSRGAARRSIAENYFPTGQTATNAYKQPFGGYATQYDRTLGAYKSAYGPDLQAAQNARDRANAQIPFMGSYYDQQRGNLQQDYSLGQRGIDLQEQGLGIDRGANQRDAAYYQNLLNILNQQKDITGLDFLNTQQQLQQRAATDVRGANSKATAGGAWLSPGRMANISDIFGNYNTGLQAAELNRRSTLLGQQEKGYGLEKSKAETEDRNAKLDILGKQYGLDREKLQSTLDQGLANLGYQQYMNTDDLLSKVDSANAQEAQVARQILQSVIQAGAAYNSGQMGNAYAGYGG